MEILDGIMDRQVLQRNSRDFCDVLVSGKCLTDGCIQMRVIKNGQTLKDLNSKTVAHVKKGKFFFNLRCIPVGGPYDITFELIDSKEDLFDLESAGLDDEELDTEEEEEDLSRKAQIKKLKQKQENAGEDAEEAEDSDIADGEDA